jgi:hypothetical protein
MIEIETAVILALAAFIIASISKGFLSAAGKDFWTLLKSRTKNRFIKEVEVDPEFIAHIFPVQNCTWIPEENLANKEKHQWTYYPHPNNGKRCYRLVGEGKFAKKEYFMVTPNAIRV